MASSRSRSTWAGADLVGDRGEVPVDVLGGLGAQVQGLVGDPAGFPGGQVAGDDAFPEPGEPVAQLEGVADVAFAGLGGQADGGGELGEGELRDQGCAGSGDRDGGVAEGAEPDGLGLVDGLGGMGDGPAHGQLEEVGLGLVGLGPPGPCRGEDACRVVGQPGGLRVVPRGGHGSIPAATTDTAGPEIGAESPCSTGVCRNSGARSPGWGRR